MLLVTGGAGFIGSNVVAGLNEAGRSDIAVNDMFGSDGKWRNLAKRQLADVVPPKDLMRWLDGRKLDAVIHMGAISDTTATDGDLVMETNFRLSLRLLDWCTAARVPFIYASSAATYGDGSNGFRDDGSPEALARLRPMNLYGASKHLFDRAVADRVAKKEKLPPQWAGLKFFNVFGPNEYHKGEMMSLVAKLVPRLRRGEPARLFRSHRADYPDGGQRRDFVYVRDCVDMVLWLWRNERVNGLFNIGTGRARSFAELAAATCRALGREPAIEFIDTPEAIREKYQYFTEARMDRLRAAGYNGPVTSLEDGVADYVATYLTASDPYR